MFNRKQYFRPQNSTRFLLAFFLVSGMMFLTTAGCDFTKIFKKQEAEQVDAPLPPRLIRTMKIPSEQAMETRSFPVITKEGETARLSFRVPGQLQVFDLKIGQTFKKDEIVAQLDKRDFVLAVERIEKTIVEANAALKAMKTGARAEDIATLEAQLAAAKTQEENAIRQYKRMENLKQDGTASELQSDVAKSGRDAAISARESVEKQLEKAKAGARSEEIEMAEAKIAGLHIDLNLAKNALADTDLKAPFDGVITEKYFDNHEMVAPGVSVVSLADIKQIEATLSVPRDMILRKDSVKKIECEFESSSKRFPATIKEVGQSVQTGNLSYPLTITIATEETEQNRRILPGMVGTAYFSMGNGLAEKGTLIPSAALIPDEESTAAKGSAVWLVDAKTMTVHRKQVKTGTLSPEGVIVSDLNPGDLIVVAGARFLTDGESVRLENNVQQP